MNAAPARAMTPRNPYVQGDLKIPEARDAGAGGSHKTAPTAAGSIVVVGAPTASSCV